MTNETYLFAANIAVWLGIAGYLAFLGVRSASMERRITQMEQLEDDSKR